MEIDIIDIDYRYIVVLVGHQGAISACMASRLLALMGHLDMNLCQQG